MALARIQKWLLSEDRLLRRDLSWQRFSRLAEDVANQLWGDAAGKRVLVLHSPKRTIVREFKGYVSVAVSFFESRVRQSLLVGWGLAWYANGGKSDRQVDADPGFAMAGAIVGLAILARGINDSVVAAKLGLLDVGPIDDALPLHTQSAWNRPLMVLALLFSRPVPPDIVSMRPEHLAHLYAQVRDEQLTSSSYHAVVMAAAEPLARFIDKLLTSVGTVPSAR